MKGLWLVFVLCFAVVPVSGQSTPSPAVATPEPYKDAEFEPWVLELRRAEIITIGAFPLAYLLTGLGYDYYYYLSNGFPQDNVPWPVGPGTSRWTAATQPAALDKKNLTLVGASLAAGVILAAVDWWLGR